MDPDPDPDDTVQFTVGGSIVGAESAVTLSLNLVSQTFSTADFTFTQKVDEGAAYLVTFVSSASGQSCTVTDGVGSATADVTNVVVTCSAEQAFLQYDDAEVTGQLAAGDFDGDGHEDLVFTIRTLPGHAVGDNLSMFRVVYGDGAGSFSAPFDVARLGSSDSNERGRQLAGLDLNGDASDEFAQSSGQSIEAFGGGTSRMPTRFFAEGASGAPLVTIDVDGNGGQDLVSIIWGGSHLEFFNLYLNDGSGAFEDVAYIGHRDDPGAQALGLGGPTNMFTGDFDGDDVVDILGVFPTGTGGDPSLSLALLSGNGSGGFDYPAALDVLDEDVFLGDFNFTDTSKEIAAGDFDGDGDLDLAMTSTTDFLLLLENDGSGRFTESGRLNVGLRPIHVRVADFDGDGVDDLLSVNADSRNLVIAFGHGDGTFGTSSGGDTEWRTIDLDNEVALYDVVVADFDGDGTPDVAVAEDGTNPPDTGRGSVLIFLAPGA